MSLATQSLMSNLLKYHAFFEHNQANINLCFNLNLLPLAA